MSHSVHSCRWCTSVQGVRECTGVDAKEMNIMNEQERRFKGLIRACNEGYAIATRIINNKQRGRYDVPNAYYGAHSYIERDLASYTYTDVIPTRTVVLSKSRNTSLVHYLENVGIPEETVSKLVEDYFLGNFDNSNPSLSDGSAYETVCWRWNPNGKVASNEMLENGRLVMHKTIGGVVNANQIIVDETTGKVQRCSQYYNFFYTIGWFGGNLLGEHRDMDVYVVQEEVSALLGAAAYPAAAWIALGYGQDLTDEHLYMLSNRRVVLYPDDMTLDYWKSIARDFHNVIVSDIFSKQDINRYLIGRIKKK